MYTLEQFKYSRGAQKFKLSSAAARLSGDIYTCGEAQSFFGALHKSRNYALKVPTNLEKI